MKQNIIVLQWKEKGKEFTRNISKEELINLMISIKTVFYSDNEISSIMVNTLPKVNRIEINKDRNEQLDMPFICCICDDGEKELVKINRAHHSIIWGIFNKLCREE